MEGGERDELLRTLVGIGTHQKTIIAGLRALLRQQAGTVAGLRPERNRQQETNPTMDTTLARMDVTLAHMKTILARILPPGETGREA